MFYFFQKNKKTCSLLFEKNNLLCKKEKKITCCEEKSQPPSWISNDPSPILISEFKSKYIYIIKLRYLSQSPVMVAIEYNFLNYFNAEL